MLTSALHDWKLGGVGPDGHPSFLGMFTHVWRFYNRSVESRVAFDEVMRCARVLDRAELTPGLLRALASVVPS
jgi:hypothetical protein